MQDRSGEARATVGRMSFEVPEHVRPIRDAVLAVMLERVEPAEAKPVVEAGAEAEAKAEGLWALGHPKELGGGGLPFMDYVYVNEIQGRSEFGQLALGTYTLQDTLMLNTYSDGSIRDRYLQPLANADISPSFAMYPSMLKTPSVMMSARRKSFKLALICSSSDFTSLCSYAMIFAPERRHPSMIDA